MSGNPKPPHPDGRDLVDTFAAMQLTRLSDRSLRRYVQRGLLTRYGTPGHALYDKRELGRLVGLIGRDDFAT